jgi:dipeptidyl aminopeptidase/acylaminoacyl peptidase
LYVARPGAGADLWSWDQGIFLRSLDGTAVRQLTAEDADDADPAFSPDGSLIAFSRDKTYNWGGLASNWDGGGVLCVMNADGKGLRQITREGSIAFAPRFSPDGKAILFWSEDGLYTVATDGSRAPTPLGLNGRDAVHSPDGRSTAFTVGFRICVARANGTELRMLPHPAAGRLAPPSGGCFRPAFTPDGKRIVFFLESWPDGATGHAKESLWEMDIEGVNPREIAGYALFDYPLHWMPGPPIQKRGP